MRILDLLVPKVNRFEEQYAIVMPMPPRPWDAFPDGYFDEPAIDRVNPGLGAVRKLLEEVDRDAR